MKFSTMSDVKRIVHPKKMARGLKLRIKKEEWWYNICSKNKGTDQLCGYRTADLHLFFHMQKAGFLMMRLIVYQLSQNKMEV